MQPPGSERSAQDRRCPELAVALAQHGDDAAAEERADRCVGIRESVRQLPFRRAQGPPLDAVTAAQERQLAVLDLDRRAPGVKLRATDQLTAVFRIAPRSDRRSPQFGQMTKCAGGAAE